jgi:hypothetical protein
MQMPTPDAHHQKLAAFAGTWTGTETMHPSPWDPNGRTCDARTTWRVDLAWFVVVVDYAQSKNGQQTYHGHGVYTIDPQNHEVVLHWFDVMGGQREEFRGAWQGAVLTLTSKNPMGFMRLTYDLSKPGTLQNRGEMSPDGKQWSALFDGVHRRQ